MKEVTYNPTADSIELDIKKSFLSIKITLTHDDMMVEVVEATPAGTYEGSDSVFGLKINAKIVIDSATAFDIDVSSSDGLTIDCKAEAYKLSGNDVVLPGG